MFNKLKELTILNGLEGRPVDVHVDERVVKKLSTYQTEVMHYQQRVPDAIVK